VNTSSSRRFGWMPAAALVFLAGCTTTQAYFVPGDDPAGVIIGEIGDASSTIDLAIYTFTHEGIRDALYDAASVRGVEVRICADEVQTATIDSQRRNLKTLRDDAGAQVRVATGNGGTHMHHKFLVVDEHSVLTGSFNYTWSANTSNDENLLALTSPPLAEDFSAAFEELWSRCEELE